MDALHVLHCIELCKGAQVRHPAATAASEAGGDAGVGTSNLCRCVAGAVNTSVGYRSLSSCRDASAAAAIGTSCCPDAAGGSCVSPADRTNHQVGRWPTLANTPEAAVTSAPAITAGAREGAPLAAAAAAAEEFAAPALLFSQRELRRPCWVYTTSTSLRRRCLRSWSARPRRGWPSRNRLLAMEVPAYFVNE